jgi:hypothetical protein
MMATAATGANLCRLRGLVETMYLYSPPPPPKDGVVQSESPGRELTSCATPNTIVFINLHGRGGHHSLLALSIVIGSRSQIGDLGLVIVLLSMDVEWISNRSVILKTADRVTITWIERIINRKLSQPIVSVYPNISTSDRPPQF